MKRQKELGDPPKIAAWIIVHSSAGANQQARTAVLQTSALSQPPVPVRGNGNGNGQGPAVQARAPSAEGQFEAALLDLADHSPEAQRLAAEEKQEGVAELINAYRIRGHLFANLDPPSDVHASADYRRHLAEVLAVRAVSQASNNARS